MAEYLDNLSYFFAAPDDRRQLVLTCQLIQANAEMLEIWRKLITASVPLFFFFVAADARRYLLHHHLSIGAEAPQQLNRVAVRIGEQCVEEICRLDEPSSLLA